MSSWSPDGQRLAGVFGGLFTFALPAGPFSRVADQAITARWLSDSRRIVFDSGQGIAIIDSQSRAVRPLAGASPSWELSSVSGDNRYLYVRQSSVSSDVWMATTK